MFFARSLVWTFRTLATCLALLAVAPVAVPAGALAATVSVMRGHDHADFSRLVLELPTASPYSATLSGSDLTVTIQTPLTISRSRIDGFRLARFGPLVALDAGAVTRLKWKVPAESQLRHYIEGRTLVIDVAGSAPPQPEAAASSRRMTLSDKDILQGYNATQLDAFGRAAQNLSDEQRSAAAAAAAAAEAREPAAKPALSQALAAADQMRRQTSRVAASVAVFEDYVELRYAFPERVPAVAVRRGDTLLLAWPGERVITHPALEEMSRDRIRKVARTTASGYTILSFEMRPGIWAGLERRGNQWVLTAKDSEVLPREVLTLDRQVDEVSGQRHFVAMAEPAVPFEFADPLGGQPLTLVATTAASAGFIQDVDLPGAELMPTVQGLVVKSKRLKLNAVRYANGIALLDLEGPAMARGEGVGRRFEEARGNTLSRAELVDLAHWADLGKSSFQRKKAELLVALSLAGEAERQGRRWDVAKFYMGHGFPEQAIGVLEALAKTDPDLLNAQSFRATRGVARLQLGEIAGALEDLTQPILEAEPEVWLWRALALHDSGDHEGALQAFARGEDVLARFPPQQRADMMLSIAESAIEQDKDELAATMLESLPSRAVSRATQASRSYWQGILATRAGQQAEAAAFFAQAISAGDRSTTAKAVLAQTRDDLARKAIKPEDAIETLEGLRYAWRGDDFELDLLEELGTLYLDSAQYREGLGLLKQAVTYFPQTERTMGIAERLDEAFRQLFLDGKADAMQPVKALALYYDFRDLTPLGSEGDTMIRGLVGRLVEVNLLDRAAGLLEHQITFRLESVPQASVAGQLAMVHLLAGKPDKAIEVLRVTRQTILPNDVRNMRNRVEAHALIDLGRPDEAEAVLEGDDSALADILRADVYWRAKDWPLLLEAAGRLMDEHQGELGIDQKRQVLRMAVAYNMLADDKALATLRGRYMAQMRGDALGSVFDLVTAEKPDAKSLASINSAMELLDNNDTVLNSYRSALSRARKTPVDVPTDVTEVVDETQVSAAPPPAAPTAG